MTLLHSLQVQTVWEYIFEFYVHMFLYGDSSIHFYRFIIKIIYSNCL